MSRRLLVPMLLLAVCLLCAGGTGWAAQVIPTDVSAYTENGRTMVPFRALLQWMGAQVNWDGKTHRIDALRNGLTVTLWVGRTEARVNGHARTLDVAPVVHLGRTFIPLRFVAQSLGARVEWDPQTWHVTIYDKDHVGMLPVSHHGPQPEVRRAPPPPPAGPPHG